MVLLVPYVDAGPCPGLLINQSSFLGPWRVSEQWRSTVDDEMRCVQRYSSLVTPGPSASASAYCSGW